MYKYIGSKTRQMLCPMSLVCLTCPAALVCLAGYAKSSFEEHEQFLLRSCPRCKKLYVRSHCNVRQVCVSPDEEVDIPGKCPCHAAEKISYVETCATCAVGSPEGRNEWRWKGGGKVVERSSNGT